MKRLLPPLVALLGVLLAVPPAESAATYPKPDSFKVAAPHAIGRVGLNDTLFDGSVEWGNKPTCKVKAKNSKCKWGGAKNPNGLAEMISTGDEDTKLRQIGIFFGVNGKGEAIINQDSPLTRFATTRGKVHLGSLATEVPSIDPDVIEVDGGFILRGKGDQVMFFFVGGPGDKFVTGIQLATT
jgi:hypothetical protein